MVRLVAGNPLSSSPFLTSYQNSIPSLPVPKVKDTCRRVREREREREKDKEREREKKTERVKDREREKRGRKKEERESMLY